MREYTLTLTMNELNLVQHCYMVWMTDLSDPYEAGDNSNLGGKLNNLFKEINATVA